MNLLLKLLKQGTLVDFRADLSPIYTAMTFNEDKREKIKEKKIGVVLVPSNVLSSKYFLGKTFFFSKIFLGDPPLIFLEVCLKFRSMER
jgi:hypothetical protein